MWNLWWTKWHWGRLFPKQLRFPPANYYSTNVPYSFDTRGWYSRLDWVCTTPPPLPNKIPRIEFYNGNYELGPPLWSSGQSSWLLNGDVLCFLWGTNCIYIHVCYVEESRPPLWSNGQSSWLQIQMSRSDSLRYQIFWKAVGLERGPLSLVSTTEELLGKKISGSGLENREYSRTDPSRWRGGTLYPQKLALTTLTSGSRSVGIVRSRTQATELKKNTN
jgi:hypothetical protein